MNIWNVLEVAPTEEISIIKKAYAKKLKIYHPEDDPEGYQILREAYDSALKAAKNKQNNLENEKQNIPNVIETSEDRKEITKNNKFNIVDNSIDENIKTEQLIEDSLKKIGQIYDDYFERIKIENWKEVLNDDIMWNIDAKEIVSRRILNFLIDHRFAPKNIWKFLNSNFYWDEQENYLYSIYPFDFVNFLFKQISKDRGIQHCYLNNKNIADYDKYFSLREQAVNALNENNLTEAKHFISLAYEICDNDPELLCIRGEYHLKTKNRKMAKYDFEDASEINPNDMDVKLYQALIYYKFNEIKNAIRICNLILDDVPDDFEARLLLGKCYLKQERWYKANITFSENLKLKPSDIETRKCIRLVNNHWYIYLQRNPWNLMVRYNLKKSYSALGEYTNIRKMKFKFVDLYFLFTSLVRLFSYIMFILLAVGICIASHGVLLIGILIHLYFKNKKRVRY